MIRRIKFTIVMAFGVVLGASALEAQVFTPTYMSPELSSDLGAYLSDGPGDFAVEGILRRNLGRYDLGVRAAVADTDDLTVLVGGELRYPVGATAPIDLAVTGFGQAGFGDATGVGFLLGLVLGYTFEVPELSFTPYLHPRVGPVAPLRRSGDSDFDLDLLADIGFNLRFSQAFELRFGVSFADHDTFGVGFAWR